MMKKIWNHLVNNRGFYCYEAGLIIGVVIGVTHGFTRKVYFDFSKKK